MSTIENLSKKLEGIVRSNLKKYDGKIKDEILKEVKKKYKGVKIKDIKDIKFVQLELPENKQEISDLKLDKLIVNKNEEVLSLDILDYTNNSPSEDKQTFEFSETIMDSWHWEIKEGVTIDYSATVKIPEIVEISESVKYDLSKTNGEAHSKSKEWTGSIEVSLPPYHRTVVEVVLLRIAGKIPFTCTIVSDGIIHCNFTLDYYGKRTRSFQIPLTRILNEKERTHFIEGEFVGVSGKQTDSIKDSYPLTEDEKENLQKGVALNRILHNSFMGSLNLD